MIEKSDSKWLSLATAHILGQPPRRLSENRKPTAVYILEQAVSKFALLFVLILSCVNFACADKFQFHYDGHIKGRLNGQKFPNNSIFQELTGTTALDIESDLRLNAEADRGPWSLHGAYQLFVLNGDRIKYSRKLTPTAGLVVDRLPNDDNRLFDLTSVIRDRGRSAALHRLDRLWFGYTDDKTVLRFGRQAISWGNGFFYSPMDIVNPFNPATIDTEYKAGDDMFYGQHLRNNGHDIQAAVVFRRNVENNNVETGESTASLKYHGFAGDNEFDILLGRNYGDAIAGIGGNRSIGGAVWRGDIVVSNTNSSVQAQFVTNFSYSWTWGGKNMSGVVEYYFNGFGQKDSNYDPASLATNPELLLKLARGELFTLGRHYLGGALTAEMTPLWTLTPNLFVNLRDPSALLQLVTQNSLSDNLTFLGALNIPMGPAGSEFGGVETGIPGQYFSTDLSLFAQIAWYF